MAKEAKQLRTKRDIIFYVPNLIGYLRISLCVCASFCLPRYGWSFIALMLISAFTDLLDGIAARKLNQCSRFGELLDIIADIACRTLSWIAVFVLAGERITYLDAVMCIIIPTTEWVSMLATQIEAVHRNKKHWKRTNDNAPWLLRKIFENGFKNPIGCLTIAGLFGLPLAKVARIILSNHPSAAVPVFSTLLDFLIIVLFAGRALGFWAETWVIGNFLDQVLEEDAKADRRLRRQH
mmetsp:Transcript_28366/g.46145  ORF Transcript_28366/g.46145 Transcript_28366/m.46145 type:complete len:237 (+) Transcript_28366:231-941(+)